MTRHDYLTPVEYVDRDELRRRYPKPADTCATVTLTPEARPSGVVTVTNIDMHAGTLTFGASLMCTTIGEYIVRVACFPSWTVPHMPWTCPTDTLRRRAAYGGKKGRAARKRLGKAGA